MLRDNFPNTVHSKPEHIGGGNAYRGKRQDGREPVSLYLADAAQTGHLTRYRPKHNLLASLPEQQKGRG